MSRLHPRARAILRRLAPVPFVLLAVATLVFLILRVVPGDPASALNSAYGSAAQVAHTRHVLGLDRSILAQYWIFLKGLVHLDFGVSFYSGRSVGSILGETVPVTVELAVAGGVLMIGFGLLTGTIAAVFRGRWPDTAASGLAAGMFSVPWFVTGVLLLIIFTSLWPILPGFGRLPPTTGYTPHTHFVLLDAIFHGEWSAVGPWISHLILPAATVAISSAGLITRITRSSLIATAGSDHVRTARAKGMGTRQLYRRHIARNSMVPILAVIGLQTGSLLGGAVISEVVFSYPGVGNLLINAISQRDYPVVEGAVFVVAAFYVLINTLTDASYPLIDPRLK